MTRPRRILHVASFYGNVGDAANHAGFYSRLKGAIGDFEVERLEIRRSYWGEWAFDDRFVDLANAHDLVVFGGGNFFELWVEKSRTGCTIDLPPELAAKIHVPMYFNGLGCDPYKGAPEGNILKFRRFLDGLLESGRNLVTCRNDGSWRTLNEQIGAAYSARIREVPDGGFFVGAALGKLHVRKTTGPTVGISLAGDMPELRFGRSTRGWCGLGHEGFVAHLASTLERLDAGRPDVEFVFFPHVFRDLELIGAVFERVSDRIRRTKCRVAPYVVGPDSHLEVFGEYAHCDAVFGMRFHSLVCSIGMGKAPIGLVTYPKVLDTLEGVGLGDLAFRYDVSAPETLSDRIMQALDGSLVDPSAIAGVNTRLGQEMDAAMAAIRDWLGAR